MGSFQAENSKQATRMTESMEFRASEDKTRNSQLYKFSSVQLLSHVWLFGPRWLQRARLPCPSPTPGAYSNSHLSLWWCHPTISSPVVPFSSCLQYFPASGSFPMSQLFVSGGQSIGISALASILPMNIQDWFPLGWTHRWVNSYIGDCYLYHIPCL